MELRKVTLLAVVLRIIVAAIIGGLIGLERELKNRPAGLRTYMVVCLGACLIMLTNQYIFQVFGAGDPVRMGAQVVSGIGFLGAGTIMVTRRAQVKGLTTAAGLWTAAAVGMAVGVGFYEAAIVSTAAVYVIMTLMQVIDNNVQRKSKTLEIYVELNNDCPLGEFLRALRTRDIEVRDIQHEHEVVNEQGARGYLVYLKLQKRQSHLELLEDIHTIPGITYLEKF